MTTKFITHTNACVCVNYVIKSQSNAPIVGLMPASALIGIHSFTTDFRSICMQAHILLTFVVVVWKTTKLLYLI